MSPFRSLSLLLLLSLAGCEEPVEPDDLYLDFTAGSSSPPVDVDVRAEGSTPALPELDVAVGFGDRDTEPSVPPAVVFEQYRVVYDLAGHDIDYYANALSLEVTYGEESSTAVRAAGYDQLDQAWELAGGSPVAGSATLELAGYDHNDMVVVLSGQFDITFADY